MGKAFQMPCSECSKTDDDYDVTNVVLNYAKHGLQTTTCHVCMLKRKV